MYQVVKSSPHDLRVFKQFHAKTIISNCFVLSSVLVSLFRILHGESVRLELAKIWLWCYLTWTSLKKLLIVFLCCYCGLLILQGLSLRQKLLYCLVLGSIEHDVNYFVDTLNIFKLALEVLNDFNKTFEFLLHM